MESPIEEQHDIASQLGNGQSVDGCFLSSYLSSL